MSFRKSKLLVPRFGSLESLEERRLLAVSPIISEFMASNNNTLLDSQGRSSDWIEIHNPNPESVNLTGWHLTDNDNDLGKWTFPNASLGANGYLVVFASGDDVAVAGGELHTNFKLSEAGEFLALVEPNGTMIVSAFAPQYPAQLTDVSYGLSQDGLAQGYFTTPTPGAANSVSPVADPSRQVVINEIMYHPSSENDAEEFIELRNIGPSAVNVNGWKFTNGIDFTLPNVSIAAGGYLVVAADPTVVSAKYPSVAQVVGGWSGRLSNSGETIELQNDSGTTIDRLSYADEGDWSQRLRGPNDNGTRGWIWSDAADGGGRSLELINSATTNEYGQNWSASTANQGTPGVANSVTATNIAPIILDVSHSPALPHSTDSVHVTARLIDETIGATTNLLWRNGTGSFASLVMHDDGQGGDQISGDGILTATIPAQTNNSVVEFYVQATDTTANVRTWPAATADAGQVANALYQVDNRFDPNAEWTPGSPPVYYEIMTAAERRTFENIDRASDAQMNATLITVTGTGIDVRYNTGIRIRGSGSRTDNPPNNRINVPSDRLLAGISGLNINEHNVANQIAGSALFRLAGLPAAEAKAVQLLSNGVKLYGNELYTHVEPLNQDFVSNQFPLDNGGNLYKGRRPDESPPGGQGAGLSYHGEDPVAYSSYIKQTNASANDWTDVIRLTDVLNNSPDEGYVAAVEQVVDIDQWLRFFAMNVLVDNSENGLVNGDAEGDDYAMYRGIVDARFKMVPHDLDTLFRDVNGTLFGTNGVPALNKFVNHPEILPRYYAQLRDLAENVVTTDRAELTLREALRDVSSNQQINTIVRFLQDRATYVLSQIPSNELSVTSTLPTIGEFHRSTSAEVVLHGVTSDQARSVLVNGQPAPITGIDRTWSIGSGADGPATTLVARNSTWRYLDDGSNQGTAWRQANFADSTWQSGAAELGYGDNDERTVVSFGPSSNNKYITTYFRHEFNVADASNIVALKMGLQRDDGAAVYLNGVEVVRDNLPSNAGYNTAASNNVGGGDEDAFFEFAIDPALLASGRNVLAVEVHQDSGNSSDISFNLELEAFAQGDVTGIQLNPGINRLFVESFDGPAGTGARIDSTFIDIWYDDGNVQNVSGTLPAGPIVWTAADGPYRVSGKLIVPSRGHLTIEPGTSVYFDADASIEARGILVAAGTPYEHIRFTSVPNAPFVADNASGDLPDGPPHWNGIQFVSSKHPENLLSFVDVENAQTGDGAIGATSNSELIVDNATFRGTHLRMVHIDASSVIVQNSTFPDMFAANEIAASLGLDNVSEHIKATGTIPSDGHLIFRNNVFGTNKGHNDVIDADSGRRPDPIVQILDNVFLGSGDEEIDLGGDAYIAGNVFMNIFKDDETSDRGYANGISTGDSGADTTTVVARNVFWNVDHAINLKRDAATIFENNTVVGIHDDFNDRFNNPNIGSAINFFVDEPGATAGTGAYVAGNIFWDSPRVFGNVDQLNTKSALQLNGNLLASTLGAAKVGNRAETNMDLGTANILGDPRFMNEILGDFQLGLGSPASSSGLLGTDMGATTPAGIAIAHQPTGSTGSRVATLTVGGPGIFAYRYRVNGGPWSADLPIGNGFVPNNTVRTAELRLENLSEGLQTVEVLGQDFAGEWQAEPTTTSWMVESTAKVVLSEVLASNTGAVENGNTRPDYIELKNVGGIAINLKGFGVSDNASKTHKFTFADDAILQPEEFLVVFADAEVNSPGIHLGFSLSSEGESVYLSQPMSSGGELVDTVTFGPQVDNLSISRIGSAQTWQLSIPTPSAANHLQSTGDSSTLRINEWLASDDTLADFIELYNSDELPVSLDGLFLTDELAGWSIQHQIQPLSFVAGNGFVALSSDRPENLSFKLSSDQEGLALLDSQQKLIDMVIYYPQTNNVSQGRFPDGDNAYQFFDVPTPGRANGTAAAGDFNGDDRVDAQDIGALCTLLRFGAMNPLYDLTNDGAVDSSDLDFLIRDILKTHFGDANLDGRFDSTDLIQIFQSGQYEDQTANNSTWISGDWNCDGEFSTSDLVVAFEDGGYSAAAVSIETSTARVASAIAHVPSVSPEVKQQPPTLKSRGNVAGTRLAKLDALSPIDSVFEEYGNQTAAIESELNSFDDLL